MERRELEGLPGRIEALEEEQAGLQTSIATADYHRRGSARILQDRARLEEIETELVGCLERWVELEARGADAG